MFKFNIGYKHLVPRSYWGNSESPTRLRALPPTAENIEKYADKVCQIPGNVTWYEFCNLVSHYYTKDDFFNIDEIL